MIFYVYNDIDFFNLSFILSESSNGFRTFIFSPYDKIIDSNSWFLFGMDNKNKVLRHFPLDRIINTRSIFRMRY